MADAPGQPASQADLAASALSAPQPGVFRAPYLPSQALIKCLVRKDFVGRKTQSGLGEKEEHIVTYSA